jgi:hypothetical protein
MSNYRTSKIESALSKKGFVQHNTHHKMFTYYFDGKKTSVRTRMSHGIDSYGDNLLSPVAKQLRLSKRQLEDFIECPLTAEKYADHLLNNKYVSVQPVTQHAEEE